MKRRSLLLIIFLLLTTACTINKEKDKTQPIIKSEEKELLATLSNIEEKSITIITPNNSTYILTTDKLFTEYKKGDKIKIIYRQDFDRNKEQQSIEIIDIKKDQPDQTIKYFSDEGMLKDYYSKAYDIVKTMTLEEKIGQLLLIRCPETIEEQHRAIKDYHIGGFVLFKRDFDNKSKEQVINTIKEYQTIAKIPLLIATDEEGGTVVRASTNSSIRSNRFKSPQDIYNESGIEGIINDTKEKATLLKELGININLAPVADISTDPNDYIYKRTFGKNANETATFVKEVVKTTQENGVSATLKHFPGYGNNIDTHTGIAIDNRNQQSFITNDFIPFQTGIEQGVDCILVSHNIISAFDNKYPATLSTNIHNVLRNQLNFTGIIMTDDLEMGAIKNYTENNQDPSVKAIIAGNDIVLVTDYKTSYKALLEAVTKNEITEARIDQIVTRLIAFKQKKNLLP